MREGKGVSGRVSISAWPPSRSLWINLQTRSYSCSPLLSVWLHGTRTSPPNPLTEALLFPLVTVLFRARQAIMKNFKVASESEGEEPQSFVAYMVPNKKEVSISCPLH